MSTAEMVALEQEWLASGLPVPALMEKVGLAMAAWCLQQPGLLEQGVLVLVGPGHNGGDGLVVARELAQVGIAVRIVCPLPLRQPLTQQHYQHVRWLGVPELEGEPDPNDPSLWIEALFGLGQTRPLPLGLATLLQQRQRTQPGRLVSLDLPAGLDGDSGRPFAGGAAMASATLTVGLIKRGLVQDCALAYVGRLHRIDAGVPRRLFPPFSNRFANRAVLMIGENDLQTLPRPHPPRSAMKYERGRVLVVAGSERYRGAALLALQGVLASGVGSVQAALPQSVAAEIWQLIPEVVLAAALPATDQSGLDWGGWLAGHDLQRLDALLFGPGLGENGGDWAQQAEPLRTFPGLLVLDADGLNQMAASPCGWQWLRGRLGPTLITPHAGEFARVFPKISLDQPLEAARAAAACSGATVLLKGAHPLLASPQGSVHQLISGNPRAARTGLGDVLAGFTAGWGAQVISDQTTQQSLDEMLAAAALLHGEAARSCDQASTARAVASQLSAMVLHLNSPAG